MVLTAMLRDPEGRSSKITAEADDYPAAKAEILSRVPEGWTLLWLSQW